MFINKQITLGCLTIETIKTIPGIYCGSERTVLFMESVIARCNPDF